MRIVFAGSPEIAISSLVSLAMNFDISAVITNPDKITGRGRKIQYNPVKTKSLELGLNVLQPETLGKSVRDEITKLNPDLLVAFAYGKIFGPLFLSLFPMGGINVHPSLLPKYRGSSPILTAILNGDNKTGITIQRINLEMDTGSVLKQKIIMLNETETTESLSKIVSAKTPELLITCIKELESGLIQESPQDDSKASYCKKILKEDGLINWSKSALSIDRKIRAYTPWPKAYTFVKKKKLMLLKSTPKPTRSDLICEPGTVLGFDKDDGILIQTGDGILSVQSLQLQSKKANNWKSFINGMQNFTGSVLGGD